MAAAGLGVLLAAGLGMTIRRSIEDARLLRAGADTTLPAPVLHSARASGKRVFEAHCAACHGPDGRGATGPDLTDADWLYGQGSAGEIEQVVAYGVRSGHPKGWSLADMPAYGEPDRSARAAPVRLGPSDIRDLVAFLRAKRGASAAPDAVERGQRLWSVTAGCYDCHAPDAGGDPAVGAPNLTDEVWLYGGSDDQVFDSIARGRAGRMPAFAGRLSPAEIRKAALYVRSLSRSQPR